MEPIEKAKELADVRAWWLCTQKQAIQYGIKVCDEIIKEINNTTLSEAQIEYWEEVKEELRNM